VNFALENTVCSRKYHHDPLDESPAQFVLDIIIRTRYGEYLVQFALVNVL